jgi:nicotinamidase-related amidase
VPAKNEDLHGSAPDKSETALLIVDVINDLDFEEADQLLRFIPAMSRKLARLKMRAKQAGLPVIYVNDNFGRWRSDFRKQIEHCSHGRARQLVERLRPDENDYFVLKPKHSVFFPRRWKRCYAIWDRDGSLSLALPGIIACSLPPTTPTCAITS